MGPGRLHQDGLAAGARTKGDLEFPAVFQPCCPDSPAGNCGQIGCHWERRQAATQDAVGECLGLSEVGYGHYDRARQPFTVEQLFKLSRLLGRSVEHFLGLNNGLTAEEDRLLAMFRSLGHDSARAEVVILLRTFRDSIERVLRPAYAQLRIAEAAVEYLARHQSELEPEGHIETQDGESSQ